jgi:hypothetical protein
MTYTIVPPTDETHNAPKFDQHQWGRSLRRGQMQVAWSDLDRMSIGQQARGLQNGRPSPTPEWALRDSEFQEVLLRYLECRFQLWKASGSIAERLANCQKAGRVRAKRTQQKVDEWVQTYRAIVHESFADVDGEHYNWLFCRALRGEGPAELKQRALNVIENLDAAAVMHERAAEIAASVAYKYWRLGWNSPSIAETSGISPMHVRQILCRLNRAARRRDAGFIPKSGRRKKAHV